MTSPTLLLAEDDDAIAMVIQHAFAPDGYIIKRTSDFDELLQWVASDAGDVIISDVVMPSGNGLQVLEQIKQLRPHLPVVIISAQNSLTTAVKSAQGGAYDYLPKPFDLDTLRTTVRNALESQKGHANQPDTALPPLEQRIQDNMALIGTSAAMQSVYKTIARLTDNDLTVMIEGESGTGKELVARAIHAFGARAKGPFVAINMGAIPGELIESELFGHEKGAFTGATHRQQGVFAQAASGTLFLDEIGDMPLTAQTVLLRVLQQGEYVPVGGRTPVRTDMRIMCATHRDLAAMVAQGTFREDLYYRLNVVPLHLPPLRDRPEDIEPLAHYFLGKATARGLESKRCAPDALAMLRRHRWPGNVRQLENLMLRLTALAPSSTITADMVQHELADAQTPASFAPVARPAATAMITGNSSGMEQQIRQHLRAFFAIHGAALPADGLYDRMLPLLERPLIEEALRACRGNQLRAARMLGINRNTLRKKMAALQINYHRLLADEHPAS